MANRTLKQSTAANVMAFMTSSTDHVAGATGLTLTITSSADGAAFGSITPTVTERGNGWYNLALTTTHTATLGDLCLHITSAGADPTDMKLLVIAVDLADAVHFGLSGIPNATAGAANGLLIAGSNAATTLAALTVTAATTFTGNVSMAAGWTITQSTTNGHGISVTGNGTGSGIRSAGGATGSAFSFVGGSTSGVGIAITTTSGDGISVLPTAGNAIVATANGTSKHGILTTGGTAGTSDGFKAVAGTGGVDFRVTNNLPADLQTIKTQTITCSAGVTVNVNVGTTQPLNFTGTAGSALVKVDMVDIAGAAVSASTAQVGVNVVNIKGTGSAGQAGYVGLDWGTISNQGTGQTLSGTTIGAVTTLTGNTPQTGDAYEVVNSGTFGNAKLVRSATPANALNVGSSGEVDANVITIDGDDPFADGTAQAGASGSITLASGDAGGTNAYVDRAISIVGGTGYGQSRLITAYNSGTKVATVHRNWDTTPDNTSQYAIDPTRAANLVEWLGAAPRALDTSGNIPAGAIPGTVVTGSSASAVIVSGLPTGKTYVGTSGTAPQKLYDPATGEARFIASQSGGSPNYTFTLGAGTGESGPFSATPTTGNTIYICP